MDRRSVGEEIKEEERGIGRDEEEAGGENERRGGGMVFLAMQVLEIPAGGRRFPLVYIR